MEHLVGQVRKFQRGTNHWEYKVKSIEGDKALVQITSQHGNGSSTMKLQSWDKEQLKTYGFEMEE